MSRVVSLALIFFVVTLSACAYLKKKEKREVLEYRRYAKDAFLGGIMSGCMARSTKQTWNDVITDDDETKLLTKEDDEFCQKLYISVDENTGGKNQLFGE